jgi:hypothetical protein
MRLHLAHLHLCPVEHIFKKGAAIMQYCVARGSGVKCEHGGVNHSFVHFWLADSPLSRCSSGGEVFGGVGVVQNVMQTHRHAGFHCEGRQKTRSLVLVVSEA